MKLTALEMADVEAGDVNEDHRTGESVEGEG